MDFDLTQDQREIQALTRDFARAEIEPNASAWDRDHHFPRELFGKLAEIGLMGACVPEEYGAPASTSCRTSSCSKSCRAPMPELV